jgi:hypothetical protein
LLNRSGIDNSTTTTTTTSKHNKWNGKCATNGHVNNNDNEKVVKHAKTKPPTKQTHERPQEQNHGVEPNKRDEHENQHDPRTSSGSETSK